MKKIIFATVLCIITSMLLSSCRGDEDVKVIGVSQCSAGRWRDKLNNELQRELLLHDGIRMELTCCHDDAKRQIADIQHFIDEGVDAIVVSPLEEEPLTPIISKAYDAGIPVVLFDRRIKGDKYSAFVGGDNLEVGHLMATYVVTRLPHGGKVIELTGLMSSYPAKLRHEGVMEELAKYPNIEVVASVDARWDGPVAAALTDSLMRLHPDIDAIIAHTDWMACDAKDAAMNLYPDKKIITVGTDGFGNPGIGIETVESGKQDATAIYPTGGDLVMRTAINILEGRAMKRDSLLPSQLVSTPQEAILLKGMETMLAHEVHSVQQLHDRVDTYWHRYQLEQTWNYTMAAFLVVALAFIILLVWAYRTKHRTNIRLRQQQQELQKQRDQLLVMTSELEEATNSKLKFFTNISHDFRTPLSLISGPVETVLENIKVKDADNAHLLYIARRNIRVLLDLVNQILDFQKFDNGKMELNISSVDMKHEVSRWYESFQRYAEQKGIYMQLDMEDGDWILAADARKMERMVYNVIGNSIKFTSEGGTIKLSCRQTGSHLIISVSDTGTGISPDNLKRIFERFYQIDSSNMEGSGIGLALVKNFVELMHGTIDVQSNADSSKPTGTTITLTIPKVPAEQTQSKPSAVNEDSEKQIALVIDDNSDIRSFLTSLLGSKYNVITAVNGEEGLKVAQETIPDIILCDVMMPVMDGLECSRKLKNDVRTSHIPIIMLTACSLDEQRIEGLETGAEAYIAKPFSTQVLTAQVETLIRNRAVLKLNWKHETTNSENPEEEEKELDTESKLSIFDKEFVKKLKDAIEKNLPDESFNVETLASIMCLSRAQLYRKVKALTGDSPVELIRNTRLQKAHGLLETTPDSISTIARMVGFSDPSYFTRCYKAYFGANPRA